MDAYTLSVEEAMTQKKHVSRKKLLKEPDEFITFTGKIIRFMRTHQKMIGWGACGFLLIILTFSAVRYSINRAEKAAFRSLATAVAAYEKAVQNQGAAAALDKTAGRFDALIDKYARRTAGKIGRVIYAGYCLDAGKTDRALELYE